MSWFTKLFNKEKSKDIQQRSDEFRKQDFTGVMQTVVEETILASAYWLIGLVNSSLENKAAAQTQVEETSTAKPNTTLEELVPKMVTLIEQFSDRSQLVTALEDRIRAIEVLMRENQALEQSRQITAESLTDLESRLSKIEAIAKDFESQELLAQPSQNTAMLETRIAHLEKLLSRYSIVPKLIEQDRQTIAALQYRLSILEVPQNNNHHSDREISAMQVN